MTAASIPAAPAKRRNRGQLASTIFMIVMTVLWIVPILFALYVALRPIASTSKYGYVSLPHGGLTLSNFTNAWTQGQMVHYFLNSVWITVPAVILTLAMASAVAFILTRVKFRGSIALLILFTAGNLLPQQAIITPLYWIYTQLEVPTFLSSSGVLYNTYLGLIIINVTFQLGFCTFVLSNYMKSIPAEMYEAARVDGAGLFTQWWRLTLPMCRPALAALATLLTTWIYNDFFWATVLMSTGSKRPITSALNDLQGQFVSNQNMIAAAALIAAIPTLVVYLVLQKQFVAGLSLGSSKG
ncbi:carbohydrate ABC transporter permease [Rudaeicoccus suwonensis]|uniref:Multiple sugar transport system permease protein n=1 Tax=Rudaeicoccus suwonensis TaxID=657409 RepID=A0A561DVC3_9MICO|nr:carbohydrate ABC transporter permease [Rudaeicoccus suwonensis]TWE07294.1 multiple sugar transport system permease protein [Rudaeicoccus suwonensis]